MLGQIGQGLGINTCRLLDGGVLKRCVEYVEGVLSPLKQLQSPVSKGTRGVCC